MNKGLWAFSLVLVIAGILFLLAGFLLSQYVEYINKGRLRVTARVVELILEKTEPDSLTNGYNNAYFPVFEYYANGKLYKLRHPVGTYPSRYRVGQTIPLTLDPLHPDEYRKDETVRRKRLAEILEGAGILCILFAVLFFMRFANRG